MRAFCEAPRALEAAKFDAIWVAFIRPVKQLELYLDLAQSLPSLRFAVVGGFDSQKADQCAALTKRMADLANVVYLGPRRAEDVIALISQSKMLVNTSSSEGFPISMLEAWSVGAPVASLIVDPGAIIEREKLGVVSGNIANLRQDIEDLATSKTRNEQLGRNGFHYVRRHHSPETVYKTLMQFIDKIRHQTSRRKPSDA